MLGKARFAFKITALFSVCGRASAFSRSVTPAAKTMH
jgi:hypothetical protein